jgi:hypothetical protein
MAASNGPILLFVKDNLDFMGLVNSYLVSHLKMNDTDEKFHFFQVLKKIKIKIL